MSAASEREELEAVARYMFENRTRELDASPDDEDEWDNLPWRDEWIEGAEIALEGFRAAGFRRIDPDDEALVERVADVADEHGFTHIIGDGYRCGCECGERFHTTRDWRKHVALLSIKAVTQ